MNLSREKSLHHLTGQRHVNDLSVQSWQELAEAYPYFIPAQFFLAKRLKQDALPSAAAQVVKTGLYFTNPHWLQIQLQFMPEELPVHRTGKLIASPAPEEKIAGKNTIPAVHERFEENTGDTAETDDPVPAEGPVDAEKETLIENKISGILSESLAGFKKPVSADEKLDIEKEPETRLHTIDYFASQGIKIDLSAIPKDKLTSSMLKFTDWLKQMKNPNPAHVDLGTTEEMEKAVMEIAKTSNVTREVLTEAMADVLVKQGQVEKAIQLLIKLSFLNPEKSSYFAARIEQLKGII